MASNRLKKSRAWAALSSLVLCLVVLSAVLALPLPEVDNVGHSSAETPIPYGKDAPAPTLAAPDDEPSAKGVRWAAGEMLASFPAGTTEVKARETLAGISVADVEQTERYGLIAGDQLAAGAPLRVFLKAGADVEQAVAEAAAAAGDCAFQPNYAYTLCNLPASSAAASPELADGGSARGAAGANLAAQVAQDEYDRAWQLKRVYAPQAWESATTSGKVTVAVIDTGCNMQHEDLKGCIVEDYAYDFVTNDKLEGDAYGHGTHVAGIIGANANNGKGMAGVSNGAKILPIRVLDENNRCFTSALLPAYKYATDVAAKHPELNMRVVNMSIVSSDYDKALEEAIGDAKKSGIVTVCSAGNEGKGEAGAQPMYPAAYDASVSVSALSCDEVSPVGFSNYHESIDICAPGEEVYSTYNESESSYTYMNGTSMASPVVAGVFSLVFAADNGLTVDKAIDVVLSTADNVNFRVPESRKGLYGAGVVNAQNAVLKAQGKPTQEVMPRQLDKFPSNPSRVEGYWGSNREVAWYITAQDESTPNQLVIYPVNGTSGAVEGRSSLYNMDGTYKSFRFNVLDSVIESIVVKPGVKVRGDALTYLFAYLERLESADLSGFDTSEATSMQGLFYDDGMLQKANVSSFDTGNVDDMGWMFWDCASLKSIDVSNFNTSKVGTKSNGAAGDEYYGEMWSMFCGCSSLEKIDVSGFDTSNVHRMQYMFYECSSLKELKLGKIDTSKVTNMASMFCGCYSLKELDVTGFVTSNVTNMNGMFAACNELLSLDVSGFDTRNVTDMSSMFYRCERLEELDLSSFDVSSVVSFKSFLSHCVNLRAANMTGWKASKVESIAYMFSNCTALDAVDISGLSTGNLGGSYAVSGDDYAFANCPRLRSVKVGSGWTRKVDFPQMTAAPFSESKPPVEVWAAASNGATYSHDAIPLGHADTYLRVRPITDVSLSSVSFTYDGRVKHPQVFANCGEIELLEGTDYHVTWSGDCIAPGVYTATISGASEAGYTGTFTKSFEIVAPGSPPSQGVPAESPYAEQASLLKARFSDLADGAWYLGSDGAFSDATLFLSYVVDRGYLKGYAGTTKFGPEDPITRAQVAAILYRYANPVINDSQDKTKNEALYKNISNETPLSDVESGQWYTAAVNWCVKKGVIKGYKNDNTFRPGNAVTRQELATMVGRFCKDYKGIAFEGSDVSRFRDASSIDSWAKEGIAFCYAKGIVKGIGNTGYFEPASTATRAQMAKIMAVTVHDVIK